MDDEKRAQEERERLALREAHAEQSRREEAEEGRRHKRTAIKAGALIILGVLAIWFFSRGLPAWRLDRTGLSVPARATIPGTDFRTPDRGGATCALAVGRQGPNLPAAQAVTVPPGAAVTVVARCSPGVQVVDLVVTMPPPTGAMMVLATEPTGGAWRWQGELADLAPGTTLTFYGYADGQPTGQPVRLTVSRSP